MANQTFLNEISPSRHFAPFLRPSTWQLCDGHDQRLCHHASLPFGAGPALGDVGQAPSAANLRSRSSGAGAACQPPIGRAAAVLLAAYFNSHTSRPGAYRWNHEIDTLDLGITSGDGMPLHSILPTILADTRKPKLNPSAATH